ncbi:MAG: FapA family protein [bacterium]|nr:FapA family protein [bacterium]
MSERPPDQKVRLIGQGYNCWRMQVLFTRPDISAAEVSERLQEAKRDLASRFGIPDSLLAYTRLLGRQLTQNGLLVQLQITKREVPSNAPRFRCEPLQAADGTVFTDMRLIADLHPYDEWDRPMTKELVKARMEAAGYGSGWVDWDVVYQAVEQMRETHQPVENLEIARGVLPGVGPSSHLTYGVRHDQERFLDSAWIGVRPVLRGEFIVEASESASGHQWGRTACGRELPPRPGLQTRLEAGDGVTTALRGRQLIAGRDGLLVLRRYGRDRRQKDACDLVPVKLTAQVLEAQIIAAADAANLEFQDAVILEGSLPENARIRTQHPLYIEGDVTRGSFVQCGESLRVNGSLLEATVMGAHHVCIHGDVRKSDVSAHLTLHADGRITDSVVRAADVIAGAVQGGDVEGLRRPPLHRDDGGLATAIRINLRKFLETRQDAGRDALDDLQRTLSHIESIFGPAIVQRAGEGKEQRLLLRWLREQKQAGTGNYTHAEVQELRTALELLPMIREQLAAIGLELRDVTSRLREMAPENPPA